MQTPLWRWQHPNWHDFTWSHQTLEPVLRECQQAVGRLSGMAGVISEDAEAQSGLDAMLQNIITSSAIEGENLNASSVRSSLARRLGLADSGKPSPRSEGLAELTLDSLHNAGAKLTMQRLCLWHTWLFPEASTLFSSPINVGGLRGPEPMQVVSGRLDKPVVHFRAPPREGLEEQVHVFLEWFEQSRKKTGLDPLLRAGIAHFWFVTLHPFDDGNGRITRALTDLALAQYCPDTARLVALSASILDGRSGYYAILENSQRATPDITAWLVWFLHTLLRSLEQAQARIARVLDKARFWQAHRRDGLMAEQIKVLNRLLDGGEKGFEGRISASQYQAVAKVSKATATRHLADLLSRGYLMKLEAGGRSTRYQVSLHPGA